jgi:hypothetical protein
VRPVHTEEVGGSGPSSSILRCRIGEDLQQSRAHGGTSLFQFWMSAPALLCMVIIVKGCDLMNFAQDWLDERL